MDEGLEFFDRAHLLRLGGEVLQFLGIDLLIIQLLPSRPTIPFSIAPALGAHRVAGKSIQPTACYLRVCRATPRRQAVSTFRLNRNSHLSVGFRFSLVKVRPDPAIQKWRRGGVRRNIQTSDGKIEDEDAVQIGDDDKFNAFVLRVREIGVPALRRIKGHDKAMRETIVEAFVTLVDAMLHGEESGDFTDHAAHFRKALVNGGWGDVLLEDKSAVMVNHSAEGGWVTSAKPN